MTAAGPTEDLAPEHRTQDLPGAAPHAVGGRARLGRGARLLDVGGGAGGSAVQACFPFGEPPPTCGGPDRARMTACSRESPFVTVSGLVTVPLPLGGTAFVPLPEMPGWTAARVLLAHRAFRVRAGGAG
ncbi:hypothetical protein [Umezawaea sp.]|uniref:hypothetical protein n=1 Tax=Umezawaea sp. TaxID=1955258 RepID=UPI002ED1A8B4